MKKIRSGKHLRTTISDDGFEAVFHEVDNLDTKSASEADNNYERVFIAVRVALGHNEQYCCDDKNDRLSIAQVVADTLRSECLIRKDS